MIDHPISHELLAMFDRAVRDPYQAPVLVALLCLLLVTVRAASSGLCDRIAAAYWAYRFRRDVRQQLTFHEKAAADKLERQAMGALVRFPNGRR